MLIRKAFRYRLYPNDAQAQALAQNFGCARFAFNYFHAERQRYYAEHKDDPKKRSLSYEDTANQLKTLKCDPDHLWLKEANAQVLQQSLMDLDRAYQNFFAKRAKFPRFHTKRDKQAIRYPQFVTVGESWVHLPKIGPIKAVIHRPCAGKIKQVTVSKTKTGRYFASVQVETEIADPPAPKPIAVGIDLGLKSLLVTSDGMSLSAPKFLIAAEKRLTRLQRTLSRRQKGSTGREKMRKRVARQHEKVANQRADFLHKTSRSLVNQYGLIGIEDLHVKGMVKNHHLAKAISDVAWGEFKRQLIYKSQWAGSKVVILDRFYPSTKTCSICGYVLGDLPLSIREWTCPVCRYPHDRDRNAARNILFQAQPRAGMAQSHADGEDVIPVLDWSSSMKSEATRFSAG